MPNYVYNEMSVYGKKQKLNEFKRHVAGKNRSGFGFENIIPKPIDTSSWTDEFFPGWYHWSCENWGRR